MNTKIEKKAYETPIMKETEAGRVREAGLIIVVIVGIAVVS